MNHHIRIIPYHKKKFKNKKPFQLIFNEKETKKYNEPRYNILINNKENKKIWEFIESLAEQTLNQNVKFFNIPSFWDKKEYAFYALVKGSKTEIKGIFDLISKSRYPKSKIEFEY